MTISNHNASLFVVFDLDDTLYFERDYLESAYKEIAQKIAPDNDIELFQEMIRWYDLKWNVFNELIKRFPSIDLPFLLQTYRQHFPTISFARDAEIFIQTLRKNKIPFGIITDGRSVTQRNKLTALGIIDELNGCIISEEFGSEKPDERNFLFFEKNYSGHEFIYIGDNPKKDFIAPIALGWKTFCIKDSGKHIHTQALETLHPKTQLIQTFSEIKL